MASLPQTTEQPHAAAPQQTQSHKQAEPRQHMQRPPMVTHRSSSHPVLHRATSPSDSPFFNRSESPCAAEPSPEPLFPKKYYPTTVLHVADISYPESYMRTPMPHLTYEHARTGPILETTNSLEEEFDQDFVDELMESIEDTSQNFNGNENGNVDIEVWGDGKREWTGWVEYRKSVERRCSKRELEGVTPERNVNVTQKKMRT